MKRWHFWAGLFISAIFLFFAVRGLQVSDIWDRIRSANLIWLLPGLCIYFAAVWIRALRWKIFLQPITNIPIKDIFSIITIGYMGNNIYPVRTGELLRSIILKHMYKVPISASLATIITERVFDGIVIIGFILLNLPIINNLPFASNFGQIINSATLWGSIIFFSMFGTFVLSAFIPNKVQNILFAIVGKLIPIKLRGKAHSMVARFFDGLRALSSLKDVFIIMFTTIIIWLLETSFYWLIMLSFPFRVSFSTLMLLNGILNLFTTIPSSPGYIGTFDAPGIAILYALGIEQETAASYILLLHAALWFPITILGSIFFGRVGFDWHNEIRQVKNERGS